LTLNLHDSFETRKIKQETDVRLYDVCVVGLTPYLSARRKGHGVIARLLARGGACTSQIDPITFRTPDFWAVVGKCERRERLQRSQEQEHRDLQINGHFLPAIKHHGTDVFIFILFSLLQVDNKFNL